MKKAEIIISTVALTTVMLMSSIRFTTDVKAAETQVTTESADYNYDDEDYGFVQYYDKNGNIISTDYSGTSDIYLGGKSNKNDDSSDDDSDDDISDDNDISSNDIVITSYNSKVDIYKGQTVKISDLNIKYSGSGSCTATFSNNSKEKKFSNTGTFTENVGVYCNGNLVKTLQVTVYVKQAEEAPTITGVKDITCLYLNWGWDYTKDVATKKPDKWGNISVKEDYSKWVGDTKTKQIYKLDKLLKMHVKAYDCYGKDITKSIKVTGFKYNKVDKEQTVVYTVTDSDGRTTTKKCKLLIKDTIKKMDKYMYVSCGTSVYLSPTGRGYNCNEESGVFLKAGTKVHVLGYYKSKYDKGYGRYKIEIKGKVYWISEQWIYHRKLKPSDYGVNNLDRWGKPKGKYGVDYIVSDTDCHHYVRSMGYHVPYRLGAENKGGWNVVCECSEKKNIEFDLFGVYD